MRKRGCRRDHKKEDRKIISERVGIGVRYKKEVIIMTASLLYYLHINSGCMMSLVSSQSYYFLFVPITNAHSFTNYLPIFLFMISPASSFTSCLASIKKLATHLSSRTKEAIIILEIIHSSCDNRALSHSIQYNEVYCVAVSPLVSGGGPLSD